jgi:hypothetical protein
MFMLAMTNNFIKAACCNNILKNKKLFTALMNLERSFHLL